MYLSSISTRHLEMARVILKHPQAHAYQLNIVNSILADDLAKQETRA